MRSRPQESHIDEEALLSSGEGPGERVDLRVLADTLYRGKWLILSCTILALLLCAVHLQRATPLYTASTSIKYEPSDKRIVAFQELDEGGGRLDEIKTQIQVIKSPRVAVRVIESLDLNRRLADAGESDGETMSGWVRRLKNRISLALVSFEPTQLGAETALEQRQVEWLLSSLTVSQVEDTRLIKVTFSDANPHLAARIADEVSAQYLALLQEERTADVRYAREWLREQLAATRAQLAAAEEELDHLRPKTGIKALEQNFEGALETTKALSREIDMAKNTLATLQAETRAGASPDLRAVLLAQDKRYERLTEKLRETELERVSHVALNTENHPEVRRLDKEISILNDQITSGVLMLLSEIAAREAIERIRLASLEERALEQTAVINALQDQKLGYEAREREVASVREIYESILDRSKEMDVTAELDASPVTILSKAAVPEYPSSPKIMRSVAVFALLGVCLGVGIVVLLNYFDRSVKDPHRVEEQLGLATLGMIPHLRASGGVFSRKRTDRERLVANVDVSSVEAEAFRVLRTSLQYSSAGRAPQVVMVTSCLPQEGKSTVAANLAISHATRGDKVLLIDGDLKAPVLHKTFEISREPGLSDVLTGQVAHTDAIIKSSMENLDLLPAGPKTPSPTDLLESDTMEELIATLRGQYRVIILDSAPISGMADSLVLSRMTDGICLVVSRGGTPMDVLHKVVAQLGRLDARLFGVIYNDKTRRAAGPGYGSAYGYGYGSSEPRSESYT